MQSREECEEYMCSFSLKQLEQSSKHGHLRISYMWSQVKGNDSQFEKWNFCYVCWVLTQEWGQPHRLSWGENSSIDFNVTRAECSYPHPVCLPPCSELLWLCRLKPGSSKASGQEFSTPWDTGGSPLLCTMCLRQLSWKTHIPHFPCHLPKPSSKHPGLPCLRIHLMLKGDFHVECSAVFPSPAKLFPVSPEQEATPLSVIYELLTQSTTTSLL